LCRRKPIFNVSEVQTPLSDQHLMMRVKRGDVRAFDVLVARHRSAVTALARYACGPDLADDVAQAAFMSLWQHRSKYRADRGTPRTWLLSIVRNRGIDQLRSRASRLRHTVPMDPHGWTLGESVEVGVAEPADAHVVRAEAGAAIQALLDELPPAQRSVIELAYFDGLSQQEIADRLGIPLGTVKGRLRLGLGKLRSAWDRYEPSGPVPVLAAA
jgi:RNA polymerase sigma-70 factor (ECF subfamily)